jgi:ribosomal protein L18
MQTITATIAQIANDVANGTLRGTMTSSIEANLDDARKAVANGNTEVARASVIRAAKYAYGILDARYTAIAA